MINFGIIGTGNMGKAIIDGVLKSNIAKDFKLSAYDKYGSNFDALKNSGVIIAKNASDIVKECKYILLSVKPQNLAELFEEIKDNVSEQTVFISICAGISAEYIKAHTNSSVKVVLVMPNTPMMLGLGASAISRDELVTDDEFTVSKSIIESCGIAEEIPIGKMKEIIAINGSSPAFIYLFAKGFIDYANDVGIDGETALRLFAKSLEGSAAMLTTSGRSVDELIKQVSSPGGTTIAGLEQFYSGDLTGLVKKAATACTSRAFELGE